MSGQSYKSVGEFAKFSVIGLCATGVHVGLALALHSGFGWSPLGANFWAFLAAWSVSYAGNWAWTFSGATRHTFSMPRFATVSLTGFALNQFIVWVFTTVAGWPFWSALAIVVLVVPTLSFVASKFWAFDDNGDGSRSAGAV